MCRACSANLSPRTVLAVATILDAIKRLQTQPTDIPSHTRSSGLIQDFGTTPTGLQSASPWHVSNVKPPLATDVSTCSNLSTASAIDVAIQTFRSSRTPLAQIPRRGHCVLALQGCKPAGKRQIQDSEVGKHVLIVLGLLTKHLRLSRYCKSVRHESGMSPSSGLVGILVTASPSENCELAVTVR